MGKVELTEGESRVTTELTEEDSKWNPEAAEEGRWCPEQVKGEREVERVRT